jgi:hypothetical protein
MFEAATSGLFGKSALELLEQSMTASSAFERKYVRRADKRVASVTWAQ